MGNIYTFNGEMTSLAIGLGQALKERHSSAVLVDQTVFVSGDSCCKIDTYQVFDLNRRGYITINLYFFRPEIAKDKFQVKFSLFSPLWNDTSGKTQRLRNEIENILLSRGGVFVTQDETP